jgi:hypothetical protein
MDRLLSRMTPERTIYVDLEKVPEDLPERIRTLPFVLGSSASGGTLVVKVSRGGDFRKELSEQLIRLNLVPLRIEEKMPSLEEAFITITGENVDHLASGART